MATRELVLVFFVSNDKLSWTPIAREDIPEWLKDEALIDRLVAGDCVRNIEAENRQGMLWWTATAIHRGSIKPSSILIPPRLLVPGLNS